MNRTQKKCVIASAGFHLLLLLLLVVGPAFLPSRDRFQSLPVLEFVPVVTTDEMISGGGNRNARLLPPAPEQLPPQPAPMPPAPAPEPPQAAAKEPPPSPDAVDPTSEKKSHKVQVNTTLTTRPRNSKTNAKSTSSDAADTTARADAQRFSRAVGGALQDLRSGLSSGTVVDMPGPGTGGVPYANFLQAVQSVYNRAWEGRVPDGTTDRNLDALASVTIQRDGTVISWRITRFSGNVAVDRAVQDTLEYVKYAAPLPESSREAQRTVTIKFKVSTGSMAG